MSKQVVEPGDGPVPSEEMQSRLLHIMDCGVKSMLGGRGIGLLVLKHKATGDFHTVLVTAGDDETGGCYVLAKMFDHTVNVADSYELPESKAVAIANEMLDKVFKK